MTAAEALSFVAERGVVLVSAKGPVPRLTEAIAGAPIKGSWWGHPKGQQIFAILETVAESEDVLVCRLVKGKITLVHRRLWPALVRLADRIPPDLIAKVRQEHTASGRHVNKEVPFPHWVPAAVLEQAKSMTEAEAIAALGEWVRSTVK
ncbi:MAG: hypothetical protein ACREA9_19970 [Pyrinomonadaceae bacterium]